jgi:hypothetical protein
MAFGRIGAAKIWEKAIETEMNLKLNGEYNYITYNTLIFTTLLK